ncbi:protein SUPPRESSOR OF QUENCHING 1, chloroplastic isoform X5 [Magnolia sinica]|uniref:protein SUPPRESSOR OF QUENCHING 1, chloroplastic isoform X5 n=1 Tax=Magnolia sinica TaxID=86752 RepID=UPI00265958BB|nr:protein SUPPRESSOR OF QUENCHING 1, chloroplastic isoform X5 [Magnolia sinica]
MALRSLLPAITSQTRPNAFPIYPPSSPKFQPALSPSSSYLQLRSSSVFHQQWSGAFTASCLKQEVKEATPVATVWGKVSAVLFDMDGVLCNSEVLARQAAVDVFTEMGIDVEAEDFVPFMGTGDANFLGGVAALKGITGFDCQVAKKRFYEIYLEKYAKPESGIGFPGALELIMQCKSNGLKVAVASSADRVKVDANLAASDLPQSMFDAILSADSFENLKPAPDVFLAASKSLNVPASECIVVEDALAGVQAAKAAQMRCIALTTTLSREALQQLGPSLIRKEIGNISLRDILNGGGSDHHNEKMQGSQDGHSSTRSSVELLNETTDGQANQDMQSGRLQGSRRDILRYGSLGIAVSCFIFTATNWKAMQYASPKGVLNMLLGVNQPNLDQKKGESQSSRIQQFVKYISDVEASGTTPTVPEFPSKLDWLNTAPLQWHRFTVVGVHSAKFDNEKDLEAIRNAVLRYNITHPDLDDFVEAALQFYGEKKILNNSSIPLALEKDSDPRLSTSPLKFPGKLAIDVLNNRLFISDSNHNRIVVTDLQGNFIVQVGSTGEEGLRDGTFDIATFNRPQGLTYNPKKNVLYVADTENHALREIDFVNEMVQTLAGNGTKGSDYKGGGKGTSQVLNSPWDLCFEPASEIVYIAMAGQHQIWEHNTLDGVTRAFSGDGFERNLNGSSAASTSFAQPSGISLFPDSLEAYVADSESSSIRALDLKTGGSRLLAGGDPVFSENLFKFGDHDGSGSDALFQHPLGVLCGKDGQIYIADSYNHKIKKLDTVSKRVVTLAGTGSAGFKDGSALLAQLSEPSGLVEAGNGKFFIADTNNSIIRCLDLNEKDAVLRTLELKGVQPPSLKSRSFKRLRSRPSADTQIVRIDGSSSTEGNLFIKISVPEGYHFSKEAQSKFDVDIEPDNGVVVEPSKGVLSPEGSVSIHFRRSTSSPAMGRINCKSLWRKMGTQLNFSCAYHSQTNGQMEVTHHSLRNLLWALVGDKPKQWDSSISSGVCL